MRGQLQGPPSRHRAHLVTDDERPAKRGKRAANVDHGKALKTTVEQ
jgi:hypothetical protein